jgi:hypothetical protein
MLICSSAAVLQAYTRPPAAFAALLPAMIFVWRMMNLTRDWYAALLVFVCS